MFVKVIFGFISSKFTQHVKLIITLFTIIDTNQPPLLIIYSIGVFTIFIISVLFVMRLAHSYKKAQLENLQEIKSIHFF